VLTDDEKDLGVALVDIGAGTTDVQIYTDGAMRHTAVIPIAGDLITSDIAMALRTPTKDAEEIKVEYGVAKQLLADPAEQLEVPGLGDRAPRMLSRQALAGVIEPRVEEIFSLVHQVIRERLRGAAVQRHRAHRRLGGDAGHGRARRGHLPQAGAQGQPHLQRGAVRHGGQPAVGHRDGPARGGARGARARAQGAVQAGSVKTLFGRAKDWFLGNF
jgi:cell division protein FtsA